jgi:hypothetical protein
MKATFSVAVSAAADCDGCAFKVGIGDHFVRADVLGDDATFDGIVTVATPDKPGIYPATVRVVTADGTAIDAPAGRIVVHGVVAWHVRAAAAHRTLQAGDRLRLQGKLFGEDVDGSLAGSPFHDAVRLQVRKGARWLTVDSTAARRHTVAAPSAKVRKSGVFRLFAVAEDTASNEVHVSVRR